MADSLHTGVTIPTSTWTPGEQPSNIKLDKLAKAYKQALESMAKVIGPALGDNEISIPGPLDTVISSATYNGLMDNEEQDDFVDTAENLVAVNFNLSRILGPHAALNPTHLPGKVYPKETQQIGWPLLENVCAQQLPFPPTYNADFEFSEGTWVLTSLENLHYGTPGVKTYHVSDDGTLYTNLPVSGEIYLKYDLRIPNTEYPIGATYNVIPDPRILSYPEEFRDEVYPEGGEYGACKLTYVSHDNDTSTWSLELPYIIFTKNPITNPDDTGIFTPGDFEPVGQFLEEDNNPRYLIDPDHPFYVQNVFEQNTIVLYDSKENKVYTPSVERIDEITYQLVGPANWINELRNDEGGLLLGEGPNGFNSKDFFLFLLGNNISQSVAQTALNFSRHKHNGADSLRIKHSDLIGIKGERSTVSVIDGTYGGLDFTDSNKNIQGTAVPNNPHPQYLSKYGYRWGGSQGLYESQNSFSFTEDLNQFFGDFVFGPIENAYRTYTTATAELAAGDPTSFTDYKSRIDWELNYDEGITQNFETKRSHALIFGQPYTAFLPNVAQATINGATKLYYETSVITNPALYDNKGIAYTLARHGFIPGSDTAGSNRTRGLNIGWGNLFFGYREDIFGGLLTATPGSDTERSAMFRAAEFNVLVTANGQAGNNSGDPLKENFKHRDGFAVRAIKGASLWLSVGGINPAGEESTSTDGKPGVILFEANPGTDNTTESSDGLNHSNPENQTGSGVLLIPHLQTDPEFSSFFLSPVGVSNSESFQPFANLWKAFKKSPGIELEAKEYGSILDLFSLAPEFQGTATTLFKGSNSFPLDLDLLSWPFGRPMVRGRYGVNLCVDNKTDDLGDIKFGHTRKDEDDNWGPENPLPETEAYLHRELRLYGNTHNSVSGANFNLLYGVNETYKRLGIISPWEEPNSYQPIGSDFGSYAAWASARQIAFGTSSKKAQGSAIRQASFIEAFEGFRSDPTQPFVSEYNIPFVAKWPISSILANWEDMGDGDYPNDIIQNNYFVLNYGEEEDSALVEQTFVADEDKLVEGYRFVKIIHTGLGRTLNSNVGAQDKDNIINRVILSAEEQFLQNSGKLTNNLTFPRSLLGVNVELEYFTMSNTEDFGTQDTGNEVWVDGDTEVFTSLFAPSTISKMVNAQTAKWGSTNNKPVMIMSKNFTSEETRDLESDSFLTYGAGLAVLPGYDSTMLGTFISNNFPIYSDAYTSFDIENKLFCIVLRLPPVLDKIGTNNKNKNLCLPYRVYSGDTSGNDVAGAPDTIPWIEVRGRITIKCQTAVPFSSVLID